MRVVPTSLPGPLLIEGEPAHDDRGSFLRLWDAPACAAAGMTGDLAVLAVSRNLLRGTLRGMHWQVAPHEETKLVRCTRGRVYDVVVDVRADSPGFRSWWGVELDEADDRALYVPGGFAHGFLTLADDTCVEYLMTATYSPQHARGFRYDDPAVGIEWPAEVSKVSDRDSGYAWL